MKRIPALLITVISLSILAACNKDTARTISVEEVNGLSYVTNQSGTTDAYVNQHLVSGDDVQVGKDADMMLLIDTDKHLFADANTHFSLEATGSKGKTQTRISVFEGSVLSGIDNKLNDNEAYEVDTPNVTMAVRGTVFNVQVSYVDGAPVTDVEVIEGCVAVTTTESGEEITVSVTEGEPKRFESTEKNYIDLNDVDNINSGNGSVRDDEYFADVIAGGDESTQANTNGLPPVGSIPDDEGIDYITVVGTVYNTDEYFANKMPIPDAYMGCGYDSNIVVLDEPIEIDGKQIDTFECGWHNIDIHGEIEGQKMTLTGYAEKLEKTNSSSIMAYFFDVGEDDVYSFCIRYFE